jgi:hypothetical protein
LLRFLGALLRLYSYVFETALCLAALALSVIILTSPHAEIRLGWLPWTGQTLGAALAVFGLAGLLILIAAVTGRVRFLLTLFALTGFVLVTRGLFFTPWRFNGPQQASNALWLVLAMFAAFLGSIPVRRTLR